MTGQGMITERANSAQQANDDRIVLITGGTSGIGLASARRLLDEGAIVYVAGRDPERGAAALRELGGNARYLQLDVADSDAVARVFETVAAAHGRLDVLVNSTGVVVAGLAATLEPRHWRKLIDVNLSGAFFCCQAAIPLLRAATERQSHPDAAIVNLGSLSGRGGDLGMPAYNAAKAGLLNFSRSLALELSPHRIRVNVVSPGPVETPMAAATAGDAAIRAAYEREIPLGRFGQPQDVANAVRFLASPEASFITGAELIVDGGLGARSGLPDYLSIAARANRTPPD